MPRSLLGLILIACLPAAARAQQLDLRLGGGVHVATPRLSLGRAPALTGGATLWLGRSFGLELAASRSWTDWELWDSERAGYRDVSGTVSQADLRGVIVVERSMPLDAQFSLGIGRIWYRGEAAQGGEASVPKVGAGLELSYPMSAGTRFLVAADYSAYTPHDDGRHHDVVLSAGVRVRLLPLW
jgi:hypothetical protein